MLTLSKQRIILLAIAIIFVIIIMQPFMYLVAFSTTYIQNQFFPYSYECSGGYSLQEITYFGSPDISLQSSNTTLAQTSSRYDTYILLVNTNGGDTFNFRQNEKPLIEHINTITHCTPAKVLLFYRYADENEYAYQLQTCIIGTVSENDYQFACVDPLSAGL